jgi:hypothetical protein
MIISNLNIKIRLNDTKNMLIRKSKNIIVITVSFTFKINNNKSHNYWVIDFIQHHKTLYSI